ncbi:Melanocyte protein PMEL [Liparis tanakae]|uniref:Melanocyte protein PMEL n=1 Tax=Liparis tanakae TaxID=230148 RepID=A0A4Z2EEU9_9TELE|nr:Melanocyte protein PMEL [Liparis tanakae]
MGRSTVLTVAKRDADDTPSNADCVIYRYGSFCTGIEVFEGIEKVEIVQMDHAVMTSPEMNRNVLDITVTCQGSLPKEVCSVILDAECLRPIHSACNMVEPSKECQLVLRHFFNDSGVYCINVSMANDVSLAVASARVNVDIGSALYSPGSIGMVLGVLVLVLAIGIVAYSYRRFKSYRPLKEVLIAEDPQDSRAHVGSGASMFWKLLNRRGAADDCPLLQDRPV